MGGKKFQLNSTHEQVSKYNIFDLKFNYIVLKRGKKSVKYKIVLNTANFPLSQY